MKIKKLFQKKAKNVYVFFCRAFDRSKKREVLFVSFDGRSYSDNPRAVSENLHELYPDVSITWFLKKSADRANVPGYVKIKDPSDTKSYYKTMATVPVVVTNFAFPDIKKGKKQHYIQTWHGDRAFKKIQYDNPFVTPDFFRPESKEGFCDLCIAGSEYGERKFRSAFRYKGEILSVGTPRDDRLMALSAGEPEKIKASLHIPSGTKILLYAPTIRKGQSSGFEAKDIDFEKTLSCIEKCLGGKWMCLLRAHPGNKIISGVEKNERIVDVSSYGDMADLLLISDMLITDYSSTAGDYALLKRPIVLFQADREEYTKTERDFYFDVKSSPYFIAEGQEELEKIISSLTYDKAYKNCEEILKFYGCTETGKASEAVVERIIKWL